MKCHAIVDSETRMVKSAFQSYSESFSVLPPEEGFEVVEISPDEFLAYQENAGRKHITHSLDLGVLQFTDTEEDMLLRLRKKRNALLEATDKFMISDWPITDAKRAEWIAYRQALRDLPANTANPFNPVWPAPPIV